jgi:hypothetical protein
VALILSSPSRRPAAASGAGFGGRAAPIKPVRPAPGILARAPVLTELQLCHVHLFGVMPPGLADVADFNYDFLTHPENSLRNRDFEISKQNGLAFYHFPAETLSFPTSDRFLQKAQVLHKVPRQKPKILTTVVAASKNRTRFRVIPKKRIRTKAAIMVTPVRRVDRSKRLALERSARSMPILKCRARSQRL